MQVVILAGGLGTRLKPITEKIPKPMVLISNKPFLQYQLELLKSFAMDNFLLLVGYLGEQIEGYFGNGKKMGLSIKYSYEKKLLGTAGALKNAEGKIEEEFILLNGDTFLPIDYADLVACFHRSNKIGVIAAYLNSDKISRNNISIDDSNLVVDYDNSNTRCMTHIDSGAVILKKEALAGVPLNQTCSLGETVYDKLIKNRELLAYVIKQKFYDIGTFEGLKRIEGVL